MTWKNDWTFSDSRLNFGLLSKIPFIIWSIESHTTHSRVMLQSWESARWTECIVHDPYLFKSRQTNQQQTALLSRRFWSHDHYLLSRSKWLHGSIQGFPEVLYAVFCTGRGGQLPGTDQRAQLIQHGTHGPLICEGGGRTTVVNVNVCMTLSQQAG